ncbi:phosphoadenylyl-sulfate reductase [Puteibacter caeruleilacunae]|nr:phosphoadenylyl-sulfate reductase [Puteibacter caeruleilacunae]
MVTEIRQKIEGKSIVESLKTLAEEFPGKVVFTTSFGIEDQVITDLIFANDIPIRVVSLDTGRLFEETYKVLSRTLEKYKKKIEIFAPFAEDVEKLVSEKGPYSFYNSVEDRKECCYVRKVIPLKRSLEGMSCWITGIRADQSSGRQEMHAIEEDKGFGLLKYNPLLDWSLEDVMNYIKENYVPYNVLHDQGFVSIGCAPCTRAINEGDDFRAGRWWWENKSGKECGLHTQS